MAGDEKESSHHQNNKLLLEAVMTRMEQVMNSRFKALRHELQPPGSEPKNAQQRRTQDRAPRRGRERQGTSRDETTDNYYGQGVGSSHDNQRRNKCAKEGRAQPQAKFRGLKLRIPPFHGKNDPYAYLEWEKKVELVFDCQYYTEINKVKVAATEFHSYALSWWDQYITSRKRNGEQPVESWLEMKIVMRKRFVPSLYHREIQGRRSVSKPKHGVEVAAAKSSYQKETKPPAPKMESKPFTAKQNKDKADETTTRTSDIKCFKCQGKGHFANECSKKRVVLLENGELESEYEKNESYSSERCVELPAIEQLIVPKRSLSFQYKAEEQEQRENLFHFRCIDQVRICSPIVEGGSVFLGDSPEIKPSDVQQLQSICKETRQGKAELNYSQSEELPCSIQIKENTSDKSQQIPKQQTPGNYLCSQKRMKPNLLSVATGQMVVGTKLVQQALEQQTSPVPDPIHKPLSYDFQKHCKEFSLVSTKPEIFVLLSDQEEKRFGLENVKEFCISGFVFDKMIQTFEILKHGKFSRHRDVMLNEVCDFNIALSHTLFRKTFGKELNRNDKDLVIDEHFHKLEHVTFFSRKGSSNSRLSRESYDLRYPVIPKHTDMIHFSFSKELSAG